MGRWHRLAPTAQAGIDPLVDLLADPLNEALGDSRLIPRAKLGVSRHGGGYLLALISVHGHTL